MASFVYAVFSITNVASVQCPERPLISPCTCELMYTYSYVPVSCEKVDSFSKIVTALSSRFDPHVNVHLTISHSQVEDLEMHSLRNMNLSVVKLRMQSNGLRSLPESPFRGLSKVEFLSVCDNELEEIPKHALNHMPILKTLDIGRCRLRLVHQDDLKGLQKVVNLILPSNNITRIDKGAFPSSLLTLHLGRNQIITLNGTLTNLHKLKSLFINANSIVELEDELPETNNLRLIMAHNNRLERLPRSLLGMTKLETVHLHFNQLKSLDSRLQNAEYMNELFAHYNEIDYLAKDEFTRCRNLEKLNLACNNIKALNHSLLPMYKLITANLSYNVIEEFSMDELYGLRSLKHIDLSNNRIQRLLPGERSLADLVIIEIKLDNNLLVTLDGALAGVNSLRILSLPHNQIASISPADFEGMRSLEILDLTNNTLVDMKKMEHADLPNLKVLKVAYNKLVKLDKDFYGMPVLCQVNLTNNQISSISSDIVSKSRCYTHKVPGKLEIHLDDNPIMCDERLSELCGIMVNNEARIRGRSQCFENDQEVCNVLPKLFTPISIYEKFPILIKQTLDNGETTNAKSVLLIKKNGDEMLPPLIATLGPQLYNPLIITGPSAATTKLTATVPTVAEEGNNTKILDQPIETATFAPNTTVSTTTTTTTSASPVDNLALTMVTTTGKPATSSQPPIVLAIDEFNATSNDATMTGTVLPIGTDSKSQPGSDGGTISAGGNGIPPEEQSGGNGGVTYKTVEYIPNTVNAVVPDDVGHQANTLDEDSQSNSLNEEYHPEVLSDVAESRSLSIQIPVEPPETP